MYKESIMAYKQAIRIDPDYANAHYNLSLTYDKSEMYKESIESCKQAIRTNPDYVNVHYNLGSIYFFLNDRDSAIEQYEILKNLDSELANELFNQIRNN